MLFVYEKTYRWCPLLQIPHKFATNTSPLGFKDVKEAGSVFIKFFEEFYLQIFARQATEFCHNLWEKLDKFKI